MTLFSCTTYEQKTIEVFYETDMEEFLNPERGFYRPLGTKSSHFVALNEERLIKLRKPNPAAGGFRVDSSLTYRSYQLDTFRDKSISNEMLLAIQSDMDIIRKVGSKIVLRFSYSKTCCDPPFNDAPKSIILNHLDQLKPLLETKMLSQSFKWV